MVVLDSSWCKFEKHVR